MRLLIKNGYMFYLELSIKMLLRSTYAAKNNVFLSLDHASTI